MNKIDVAGIVIAVLNALVAGGCFIGIFVALYLGSYGWMVWYVFCTVLNGYCAIFAWNKVKP